MRELGTEVKTWPVNQNSLLPLLEDDPQRVGCCLFTSGSTGMPKGVLIAEQDLRNRAIAEIALFELKYDDILLNILPFSFDVGLNQLLSTITAGCSLVLLDSWQCRDILKSIEKFNVTGISGVPSIWRDLVNSGLWFDTKTAHASLRYITISGGDLAPQHLDLIPQLVPNVRIFKTYGQTESFRSTALHPSDFHRKKGSIGKPFEKVHIYIVRENGSLCDKNEVGEIVHTGLGTMLGYLSNEDAQDKLRPNPFFGNEDRSPSAIFTGDLGYLDEEGYLFLKGRRDAMLKIADNKTYPQEISNQILKIKEVREAEVVGIGTEEGHTILFAFVVLKEGITLDSEEIRQQLITQLPSYMVPREIVILTAIPRTSSAKTDYPFLAKHARKLLSTVKNMNNGN
jgi:acyl-coenzyme A synthetase/AMP-(fatty) acid ligase